MNKNKLRKKKCMLCHSDLIKTKVGFNKQLHYKDAYGVERKDYSGYLYENEYSCTNPNCIFHNAVDVKNAKDRIERIKLKRQKNKHIIIANSYKEKHNAHSNFKPAFTKNYEQNFEKNLNKLKDRWSSNF